MIRTWPVGALRPSRAFKRPDRVTFVLVVVEVRSGDGPKSMSVTEKDWCCASDFRYLLFFEEDEVVESVSRPRPALSTSSRRTSVLRPRTRKRLRRVVSLTEGSRRESI